MYLLPLLAESKFEYELLEEKLVHFEKISKGVGNREAISWGYAIIRPDPELSLSKWKCR